MTYPFATPFMSRTVESNETIAVGSFNIDTSMELTYVVSEIYIVGVPAGSEAAVMKIYSSGEYSSDSLIATSDTLEFSDYMPNNYTGPAYRCQVQFTFSNEVIHKDFEYYIEIVHSNYTRVANSYYISWVDKGDNPTGTSSDVNGHAPHFYSDFGQHFIPIGRFYAK